MKNTIITKEAYEKITGLSINFREKALKYNFTDRELEALKVQDQILSNRPEASDGDSYGHFSSFLYHTKKRKYKPSQLSESRKKVDEVRKRDWYTIDQLQDWDKVEGGLKAGYVFIGLNAAKTVEDPEITKTLSFERFENFHAGGPDMKIHNAFTKDEKRSEMDEKFYYENIHGTYITDVIKAIPTSNGAELRKLIKKAAGELQMDYVSLEKSLVGIFTDMLVEELELLGGVTHTLIILSAIEDPNQNYIERLLNLGEFPRKYKEATGIDIRYEKTQHPSDSVKRERYRQDLSRIYGRQ